MRNKQPQDSRTRLLVTGHRGFVGHYLEQRIGAIAPDVGVITPPDDFDMNDSVAVTALFDEQRPDAVVHLAAQTFVPRSFERPEETLRTNIIGTSHMLEALKKIGFSGRFLYVSSGDVYGKVAAEDLPVTEQTPLTPQNPYAVSKAAAEMLCRQSFLADRMGVIIARPFNHFGPGQQDNFVIPAMARQIAKIKLGKQPARLDTGDIEVTRDFLDVEDVIEAYWALLQTGELGETYNVCSSREYRVRDLIERLCKIADVEVTIERDPKKNRPADQKRMRGSNRKLTEATGWTNRISMDESLKRIFDYWLMVETDVKRA